MGRWSALKAAPGSVPLCRLRLLLACNRKRRTTWRLPHCLQGEVAYLLATDVAARGLDILGVETVINFDCPTQLASYLHRCGIRGAGVPKCSAKGDDCSSLTPLGALQTSMLFRAPLCKAMQ